jgi:hypothetical protein
MPAELVMQVLTAQPVGLIEREESVSTRGVLGYMCV